MFDSSHFRIELLSKVAVKLQSNFRYLRLVSSFDCKSWNQFRIEGSLAKAVKLITIWHWIEAEKNNFRLIGVVDYMANKLRPFSTFYDRYFRTICDNKIPRPRPFLFPLGRRGTEITGAHLDHIRDKQGLLSTFPMQYFCRECHNKIS